MYYISDDGKHQLVTDPWSEDFDLMPGTEDFIPVLVIDDGGFDWAALYAWYSPGQRRYFWSGQYGCSCNIYEVDFLGALQVGSREDLIRYIHEWVHGEVQYHGLDGIAAQQTVRDFKEPQQ